MPEYEKLDNDVLSVNLPLGGKGVLRRIFNFTARQVVTIYDRSGRETFSIPGKHSDREGKSFAMTSAMTIHFFSEMENWQELEAMHAKLIELKGSPPPLDTKTIHKDLSRGGLS